VSQIWSLMGLPSMVIIRAPNSTPIVRSCTGWNLLSVNCNNRHDFPTPTRSSKNQEKNPIQEQCTQITTIRVLEISRNLTVIEAARDLYLRWWCTWRDSRKTLPIVNVRVQQVRAREIERTCERGDTGRAREGLKMSVECGVWSVDWAEGPAPLGVAKPMALFNK